MDMLYDGTRMSFSEKVTDHSFLRSNGYKIKSTGISSLLTAVTQMLDRGNLLQEGVCEVHPLLSRPSQVK